MIEKKSSTNNIREMYNEEEESEISASQTHHPKKKKKGGMGKFLLTLILIVVIVFVLLLVVSKTTNFDILGVTDKTTPTGEPITKASDWQAVFLSNGQVYFGKLSSEKETYPVLQDIYYLQVQDVPIQPAEPAVDESGVEVAQETQQQMILVKFGTEIHKPTDEMFINRDHILMFENLAEDSAVVKAIEDYKAGL